jgi:hypothetical protein
MTTLLSYEWFDADLGEVVADYCGESMTVEDLAAVSLIEQSSLIIQHPARPEFITIRFLSEVEDGIPANESGRVECSSGGDRCDVTASDASVAVTVAVLSGTRVMVVDLMYVVPVDDPASPPAGDDFASYGVAFAG